MAMISGRNSDRSATCIDPFPVDCESDGRYHGRYAESARRPSTTGRTFSEVSVLSPSPVDANSDATPTARLPLLTRILAALLAPWFRTAIEPRFEQQEQQRRLLSQALEAAVDESRALRQAISDGESLAQVRETAAESRVTALASETSGRLVELRGSLDRHLAGVESKLSDAEERSAAMESRLLAVTRRIDEAGAALGLHASRIERVDEAQKKDSTRLAELNETLVNLGLLVNRIEAAILEIRAEGATHSVVAAGLQELETRLVAMVDSQRDAGESPAPARNEPTGPDWAFATSVERHLASLQHGFQDLAEAKGVVEGKLERLVPAVETLDGLVRDLEGAHTALAAALARAESDRPK